MDKANNNKLMIHVKTCLHKVLVNFDVDVLIYTLNNVVMLSIFT